MNSFQSSLSFMQWATTGYILAEAAIIPVAGWLADRFGSRRMFILAIFILQSARFCAHSVNAEQFILFRVLQGLGGGIVMPIGYAHCLSDQSSGQGRDRNGIVLGRSHSYCTSHRTRVCRVVGG